jgi:hypothetical protein
VEEESVWGGGEAVVVSSLVGDLMIRVWQEGIAAQITSSSESPALQPKTLNPKPEGVI